VAAGCVLMYGGRARGRGRGALWASGRRDGPGAFCDKYELSVSAAPVRCRGPTYTPSCRFAGTQRPRVLHRSGLQSVLFDREIFTKRLGHNHTGATHLFPSWAEPISARPPTIFGAPKSDGLRCVISWGPCRSPAGRVPGGEERRGASLAAACATRALCCTPMLLYASRTHVAPARQETLACGSPWLSCLHPSFGGRYATCCSSCWPR
jgi:hypothetical protein